MHNGIIFAIILAVISLARAQSVPHEDRVRIAELKLATEREERNMNQIALEYFVALGESIIGAGVADQPTIQRLRAHTDRVKAKFDTPNISESELDNLMKDMSKILGFPSLYPEQIKSRLELYTKGASDDLSASHIRKLRRELQLFAYRYNPTVRALSDASQQNEHELISAFNNLAYAGLVDPEDSFSKLKDALEKY